MKKRLLFIIFIFTISKIAVSQQVYCDLEKVKGLTVGIIDSSCVIYDHNGIDSSEYSIKLYPSKPNPAKENTTINFRLSSPGLVSIQLYDLLGNSIFSILDQNMKAGMYSIPVETENIPNGVYFYVLKKEGNSRSMKMIVSK